jgi:cysteine desulfurase
MSKVYLDNASTAIHPQVIDEMVQIMSNDYGNPSSTHGFGRSAKSILELSRKSIAKHFNVSAQKSFYFFGTESNN